MLQELRLNILSNSSRNYLQERVVDLQTLQNIRSTPPNLSSTNEIGYTNQLVFNVNQDCLLRQNVNSITHLVASDIISGVAFEAEEAIRQK